MASDSWEVIIIGAGAAGLAAARALAEHGRTVLVLEARDRIGGRIWSRREPDLAAPIELGAEFIHGESPETLELLRGAAAGAIDASGEHWSLIEGRLQRRTESLLGQVRKAFADSDVLARPDQSLESFLTSEAGRALSEPARAIARAFVAGFDAADPARISVHSLAEEWRSGGMLDASQSRPAGGYHTVLRALGAALERSSARVQLETVVTAVDWGGRAVELRGLRLGQPWRATARKVIVTVPLGVLQQPAGASGAIAFTPALEQKRAALEGLLAGGVLKVALRFRQAFWEELNGGRYAEASFFHAPGNAFPTLWTTLPARTALLVAWVGGPTAARLSALADAEVIRQAMACVEAVFAEARGGAQLQAAYLHNWQRDSYARGAYSYVAVGGASARETLAAPLEGTLFFAGEATETTGEATTVTGAVRSGARAALEAHQHLESA